MDAARTSGENMTAKKPTPRNMPGAKTPGDLTYGRLYDETRLYLNKSGSKFISMGVRPGIDSFRREIRLHTTGMKPFSMLLRKCDLQALFSEIRGVKGIRKPDYNLPEDMAVDDDDDDGYNHNGAKDDDNARDSDAPAEGYNSRKRTWEESTILRKTKLGSDIFKIELPNNQFMFMGLVSLQALLNFEQLIYATYAGLNADYLKSLYDRLVEALVETDYEFHRIEDVVRDSLMQEAVTAYNDRSFYTQTCMHFTDFTTAHVVLLKNKQE